MFFYYDGEHYTVPDKWLEEHDKQIKADLIREVEKKVRAEVIEEIKETKIDVLKWLIKRQEEGYGTTNGELLDYIYDYKIKEQK